jgi:TPR repeat protein
LKQLIFLAVIFFINISLYSNTLKKAQKLCENNESKKAIMIYKILSKNGNNEATKKLVRIYDWGKCKTKANYKKSFFYLSILANKGDKDAISDLATRYIIGNGINKDLDKAEYWLTKYNNILDAKTQYNIAAKFSTFGAHDKSLRWYLKSAKQNYIESFYWLGKIYFYGYGSTLKNPKEALYWWEEGANLGDYACMEKTAEIYSKSYYGLVDESKYFYWMEKAAMKKSSYRTQYYLALSYFDKNNKNRAAYWAKEAYINGSKDAKEFWDKEKLWKYTISKINKLNIKSTSSSTLSNDDIKDKLNHLKLVKVNTKNWLFVIAIENYTYTDNIKFSNNSAESFLKVTQKTLGISKRNTYNLIGTKSTSGAIKDNLSLMLKNIKKGDTIYFYYSGHGIPILPDNEPYILPKDKIPEMIGNDKFFKLSNIYKLLSDSKATKIVAFVDSCFSGATDGKSIIKGVASGRLIPKKVTFDKSKMVVLTAGKDKQYSNMYKEKGHRLFSYFIMKSLLKGKTDINDIYREVYTNVKDESYKMGDMKIQEPTIDGNLKLKL